MFTVRSSTILSLLCSSSSLSLSPLLCTRSQKKIFSFLFRFYLHMRAHIKHTKKTIINHLKRIDFCWNNNKKTTWWFDRTWWLPSSVQNVECKSLLILFLRQSSSISCERERQVYVCINHILFYIVGIFLNLSLSLSIYI